MSLTDDWKDNKLPKDKKYFIKFSSFNLDGSESTIGIAYLDQYNEFSYQYGFYDIYVLSNYDVEEVLAPCDYEDLQRLESDRLAKIEADEINAELEHRIKEICSLLKECIPFVENSCGAICSPEITYLLERITQAIEEM